MNKPKPEKRRDRAAVKVKNPDGTWRELTSGRRPSEDPEINVLWELPITDLEKILDDPEHPQHEKALAVTAQAFAPLQEAVQELIKSPVFDALAEEVKSIVEPFGSISESVLPLLPNIDTSWIGDLVLDSPAWQEIRRSLPAPTRIEPLVANAIDFDSPTPPDASLAEVATASDVIADRLDILIGQGTTRVEQGDAAAASSLEALEVARKSLTVAEESRDAARGSRTAGWAAAIAAIGATIVGIIGIIVTIANAPR
jgi:hypothetical protein